MNKGSLTRTRKASYRSPDKAFVKSHSDIGSHRGETFPQGFKTVVYESETCLYIVRVGGPMQRLQGYVLYGSC